MSMAIQHPQADHRPRRSRGVSLVFSLLTLAALSLAAVALIRSVDTGATILGNLSFKQDTALAADEATRQAIAWLSDRQGANTLWTDVPATANDATYVASNIDLLDPTGRSSNDARTVIDWDDDGCAAIPANKRTGGCRKTFTATTQAGTTPGMANGVSARYFIVRLCAAPGDPNTVSCARPLVATAATSLERDEIRLGGGGRLTVTGVSQYFRILVRARGARNTVTYTETLVHF